MWLFVAHIVFSAVYLVLYPGPGQLPGTLGWTSAGEYSDEQAKARADAGAAVRQLRRPAGRRSSPRDPQAMAIGERLFLNNCATCHGSDARGSKGFPEPGRPRLAVGRHAASASPRPSPRAATACMPPMAAAVGSARTCATSPTTC